MYLSMPHPHCLSAVLFEGDWNNRSTRRDVVPRDICSLDRVPQPAVLEGIHNDSLPSTTWKDPRTPQENAHRAVISDRKGHHTSNLQPLGLFFRREARTAEHEVPTH